MIWSNIVEKKTQQYLHLLSLLKKRVYSFEELANELKISKKTLRRDLSYLQEHYHLDFETKKVVVWNNPQQYSACYKALLRQSRYFTLFSDALWERPINIPRSTIRRMNDLLQPYHMLIDYQTQRLRATRALVFKLQLRYLQEFNPDTIGRSAIDCWEQLKVQDISEIEIEKWQQLIVDRKSYEWFVKSINPSKELSSLLYFEYQKSDPFRQQKFYQSHQQVNSFLYQAACGITDSLMYYLKIAAEFKSILRLRFFYILVDLYMGIPITYFSGSQWPIDIHPHLIKVSDQIKAKWAFLANVSTIEVALLFYSILKRIYPVSMGRPAFSIGLKLNGPFEEIEHLCVKLNQAIQFSYPIAFYPVWSSAAGYDLLIVEGPPAYEDVPNEVLYIEDPSFGDLIQLAVHYFPSKKGDTVFTIP